MLRPLTLCTSSDYLPRPLSRTRFIFYVLLKRGTKRKLQQPEPNYWLWRRPKNTKVVLKRIIFLCTILHLTLGLLPPLRLEFRTRSPVRRKLTTGFSHREFESYVVWVSEIFRRILKESRWGSPKVSHRDLMSNEIFLNEGPLRHDELIPCVKLLVTTFINWMLQEWWTSVFVKSPGVTVLVLK